MADIENIKANELIENPTENVKDFEEKSKDELVNDSISLLTNDGSSDNRIRYPLEWMKNVEGWQAKQNGLLMSNYYNVSLALKYINDHTKDGRKIFTFDEFTKRIMYNGESLKDRDVSKWYTQIAKTFVNVSETSVRDAIYTVSYDNPYNSVNDYLNSVKTRWDGISRIERFFIDYVGSDDTPLIRYMTKLWWIGVAKRIMQPGCKNDVMLITYGPQGIGKTSCIEIMTKGLGSGYDGSITIDKLQDYGMKLDACVIAGFDELTGFTKKESESMKSFLSTSKDTFRSPYGHQMEDHLRHCSFYGTTNDECFLKDTSDVYERRYWIIDCSNSDASKSIERLNKLEEDRDQLWGEIMSLYDRDKDVKITIPFDMICDFISHQQKHKMYNEDAVPERLAEILDREYVIDNSGTFESEQDMIEQIRGISDKVADGIQYRKSKLSYIKSSYVRVIMQEVLKRTYKHNDFRNISVINDTWRVNVKYNKVNTYCYIRR